MSLELKSTGSKLTAPGASNSTVYKIILARQQLEHNQDELAKFFEEIKIVFSRTAELLTNIKGSQYYEAEKNLDRMI